MGLLQKAGGSISRAFKSGGAMSDIGNALTGTSSEAGLLGLGQYKAKPYDIDEKAFTDTTLIDARKQNFANELKKVTARKAPTAATAKIGDIERFQGATIGDIERMNAAQIANSPEMQAAQIGNITPAQAAQIAAMREIQGAGINTAQSDQVRAQQMALAAALQQQAAGLGPSLAQTQLRQGTDRNIAQAMALAASARGGSAGGLGMRQIRQQTMDANQQAAQQAALIRAQEQMSAREQLAGVLAGTRASDIGLATSQADLLQQANMSNQAAVNQAAMQQAALQQQTNLANMDVAAQQAFNQAQLQQGANQMNTQVAAERAAQQAQLEQQALANNQAAFNQRLLEQANLQQQAGLSNQAAYNTKLLEQAKLTQSTNLANQQANLQQTQLNDALRQFYEGQGVNLDLATMQALQNLEQLKSGQNVSLAGINQQGYDSASKARGEVLKKLGGGAGEAAAGGATAGGGGSTAAAAAPAAAASDENLKDITADKKSTRRSLQDFVKAIGAHQYTYKDKKWGGGEYISPMAQELEKSKLGKDMVIDTPEGKIVDYGRGFGTMLATAGMLNERMEELEKAFQYRAKRRA